VRQAFLLASLVDLVPQRAWLERLALLIPGPTGTRWLLVADAACLLAVGLVARRPWLAVPAALAGGFFVLNVLGLAVTDFYLALALFHLAVGLAALLLGGRARWTGAVLLLVALSTAVLT
jgi:hypothetical protein